MTVYEELRDARIAQGVSLREMSDRTGIPYQNIQRFESGRTNATVGTVRRVAEGLGLKMVISFERK